MVGSGRVGNLSAKQETTLQEFKTAVGSILQPHMDDHYLLRWLRARNFDVKKAENMLRTSLEWRKKNDVDNILTKYEPPEVLLKYYPGGMFGFDKEGYPVWIDNLGFCDIRGMALAVKKADIIRYRVWYMETLYKIMDEQSKKLGRKIDQAILLFDMEKIGIKNLWKPAIDVFTEILSTMELNYPETLRYAFVCNAPRVFPICWNLAKPFLHEETRKKVHVFDRNWKAKLLEFINPDQLPVYWGGTATGPNGDIYCGVCLGGDIPESFKASKLLNPEILENFTTATIGRGSSLQVDVKVVLPGSGIRWQFQTDGNDIGFGVYQKTAEGHQKSTEMVEIYPTERFNSHIIPEDGSITCDKPGTYVVRFDNTYSWVNAKKLSYLIEVLEPTPEDETPEEEVTAL